MFRAIKDHLKLLKMADTSSQWSQARGRLKDLGLPEGEPDVYLAAAISHLKTDTLSVLNKTPKEDMPQYLSNFFGGMYVLQEGGVDHLFSQVIKIL